MSATVTVGQIGDSVDCGAELSSSIARHREGSLAGLVDVDREGWNSEKGCLPTCVPRSFGECRGDWFGRTGS